MPFCALPKNIADIIVRKRVVINESNVHELLENSTDSLNNRNSIQTTKKSNRLSNFMMNSPRSAKSNSKIMQTYISSEPILASASTSNPFYDNRFPVIY